jgi:hypothetical protein
MDEPLAMDEHFNQWFSSYGLITIERLLAHYDILLPPQIIPEIIRKSQGFYHHLLEIPMKNVLNGIILQQANDYHVYAQKLFIDYLLSGQAEESEEDKDALVKEAIEEERLKLIKLGETFQEKMLDHEAIIASSQSFLIRITNEWRQSVHQFLTQLHELLEQTEIKKQKSLLKEALNHALIHADWLISLQEDRPERLLMVMNERLALPLVGGVKEQCLNYLANLIPHFIEFKNARGQYLEAIALMKEDAQSLRTQFYQAILTIKQYLLQLPNYVIDPDQDVINQEGLYFDNTIGEAKG